MSEYGKVLSAAEGFCEAKRKRRATRKKSVARRVKSYFWIMIKVFSVVTIHAYSEVSRIALALLRGKSTRCSQSCESQAGQYSSARLSRHPWIIRGEPLNIWICVESFLSFIVFLLKVKIHRAVDKASKE